METSVTRLWTTFAIVLILAVGQSSCSNPGESEAPGRVLIIGIDGASPRVTKPLMDAGRLPNLARLAQHGVSGPLRSALPLFSPRIWNTIATGRRPEDHGVISFVKPDPEKKKEQQELYLSTDRKVPALWNIISEAGLSVAVINWWTTYPPEIIEGVMVSDHFFPDQISRIKKTFKDSRPSPGALIHPESWTSRAESLLDETTNLTDIPNPFTQDVPLPRWVNRDLLISQYENDELITHIALGVQQEFHPDVLMVFLPGIDRVSHWLWGNLEPDEAYPEPLRPTRVERRAGSESLMQYYEFTDRLIGRLLESYGPDDLIIVISDHGFEAHVSMMLLTGGHETEESLNGVLFAMGRGLPKGQAAGPVSVFNLAPTVLAWLGLPVGQDMVAPPAGFLDVKNLATIASYDDIVTVERAENKASGKQKQIIEELRALGYLEEESPSASPDSRGR